MRVKLTEEEKQVQEDIDSGLYVEITDEKEKQKYATYAKNHIKNKRKNITIRADVNTLEKIKNIAENNGLNYQTYINMVLHNIANDRIKLKFKVS